LTVRKKYPVPDGYYPSLFTKEPFENPEAGAAISTLLIALHEGLVSARRSTPCLSGLDYTTNEQKNENTYVIGLTITDSIKPGFTVGVGPVTFVDASHNRTVMNENTLTVTFRQIDLDTLPRVSSKAVPHHFPVVVYSAHHALAVKPGPLEISDSTPAPPSRGRKVAPQAAQEKQVLTLCRDDDYFTYWCVNKTKRLDSDRRDYGTIHFTGVRRMGRRNVRRARQQECVKGTTMSPQTSGTFRGPYEYSRLSRTRRGPAPVNASRIWCDGRCDTASRAPRQS